MMQKLSSHFPSCVSNGAEHKGSGCEKAGSLGGQRCGAHLSARHNGTGGQADVAENCGATWCGQKEDANHFRRGPGEEDRQSGHKPLIVSGKGTPLSREKRLGEKTWLVGRRGRLGALTTGKRRDLDAGTILQGGALSSPGRGWRKVKKSEGSDRFSALKKRDKDEALDRSKKLTGGGFNLKAKKGR